MKLENEEIWFCVNKNDWKRFLIFAKNNNCKWINGEEINPKTDNCSFHMSIYNHIMAHVPMYSWFYTKNKRKVVNFDKIKWGINNDKNINKWVSKYWPPR